MTKKLKKWQSVRIKWLDSMHEFGWKHEEDLDLDDKYLKKESIGFFYKETNQAVAIIQSKDNDGEEKRNVDGLMVIPKVSITRITKI